MSIERYKGFPVLLPNNAGQLLKEESIGRWEETMRWGSIDSYLHEEGLSLDDKLSRHKLVWRFGPKREVIRFKQPKGKEDDYFVARGRHFALVLPQPDENGMIMVVAEFHGEEDNLLIIPVSGNCVGKDGTKDPIEVAVREWREETGTVLTDPTALATVSRDDGKMTVVTGRITDWSFDPTNPPEEGEVERAHALAVHADHWRAIVDQGDTDDYSLHIAGVVATRYWERLSPA